MLDQRFGRHRHCHYLRRRRPIIVAILPSLLVLTLTLSLTPNSNNFASPLIFAGATNVQWQGNNNIPQEHQDAHNAPRSQKYWDENGIKRPDYGKTDSEIAAERREKKGDGSGGGWGNGIIIILSVVMILAILPAVTYAKITGDWDTTLNNPVGACVSNCINCITETVGMRGHTLGSTVAKARNDEDARRVRLARFDNKEQKNMLDSVKSE